MAHFGNVFKSFNRFVCGRRCRTKEMFSFERELVTFPCFSRLLSTSSAARYENNIEIDSDFTSLKSRGFLRSAKSYDPPIHVRDDIFKICKEFLHLEDKFPDLNVKLVDGQVRFQILIKCIEHFNHNIPNSELHNINTLGDLIGYFEEPVTTSTSFDDLCTAKLPPNVHVQHDYVRFHPDTDTMFGGVSAFPKRSTLVTGLKYKKIYKGFKVNKTWTDI